MRLSNHRHRPSIRPSSHRSHNMPSSRNIPTRRHLATSNTPRTGPLSPTRARSNTHPLRRQRRITMGRRLSASRPTPIMHTHRNPIRTVVRASTSTSNQCPQLHPPLCQPTSRTPLPLSQSFLAANLPGRNKAKHPRHPPPHLLNLQRRPATPRHHCSLRALGPAPGHPRQDQSPASLTARVSFPSRNPPLQTMKA